MARPNSLVSSPPVPAKARRLPSPVREEARRVAQQHVGQGDGVGRLVPAAEVGVAVHAQPHVLGLLVVERVAGLQRVDGELRGGGEQEAEGKKDER